MLPSDLFWYLAVSLSIVFLFVWLCYVFDENRQKVDKVNAEVIEVARRRNINYPVLLRCVYCHGDSPEFTCTCNAWYHIDCWNELKDCATIGCYESPEKYKADIGKIAYFKGRLNSDSFKNWIEAEKEVLYNLNGYKTIYRKIL